MNTHEYTRIRKNIIYDYSCLFMIIHVEKKRNTNTHEYTRIRKIKIMIIHVEKRKTRIARN